MKFTWLGHSGFRAEIGGTTILIDPWFTGNPMFDITDRGRAIEGVEHILLSHGHHDHSADVVELAKELDVQIAAPYELAVYLAETHGVKTLDFGIGGTIQLGGIKVTMVPAMHSSSLPGAQPIFAGAAVGYMLEHHGRTAYFSGDTDVTMEMELMQALHRPQIGILSCGGHYTMDMKRAAYAARRFFHFETIIPCHYKTMPLFEQSVEPLVNALPEVSIVAPNVMETVEV